MNAVLVAKPTDLLELKNSESRVMLLYATSEEANLILKYANDYNITGENYVWVVTQSVIEKKRTLQKFPIGMLGECELRAFLISSMAVFFHLPILFYRQSASVEG